jgi:methionyl-tRNA formyltransferase
MYHGEKTAGVTIQRVNAGLDTGDVVRAGEVPIGRRSLHTVWQELEALGFDLYLQAIVDVKRGTAHYRPQLGKKGPLYHDPTASDILKFQCRQLRRRLRKY